MYVTNTMRWSWMAILLAVLVPGRALAQDVDPAYRFREHRTRHFAIYFHQNEERLADVLAAIVEETWTSFAARPGVVPPPLTHVVLTDQSDSANGFANPLPRNTIFLYPTAPAGADHLNPRDWLRTVFVHEFTHIVHLDRSEGWARLARRVFGRAPWAFPNLTLPTWQIEGLATWTESLTPGMGRLHSGDFLAVVGEAARARRIERLDRVNGGLTDWPGGSAPYAYGLGFHDYLAKRFGAESFATLSNATARSLPWLGTLKFEQVYGSGLGELWNDYHVSLANTVAAPAEGRAPARRLTRHGYAVTGPRYLRTCEECPGEVAYSVQTPYERAALYRVNLASLETEHLTTRVTGSTFGVGSDGTIYFDEQDLHRNVGVYSDLRAFTVTGTRETVMRAARIADPDVSPDGRMIVAVQNRTPGQRDLVLIDLALAKAGTMDKAVRVVAGGAFTQFNAPRWSPDGRRVVVERQYADQPSQIAVVDTIDELPRERVVTAVPDMRWATPAWRPDGQAIIAAAATVDGPYNLHEVSLVDGATKMLTHSTGGATWPDVSRDGSTLVYVEYGVTGSDVYEQPYTWQPSATTVAAATARSAEMTSNEEAQAASNLASRSYRPLPTLLPTSWTPLAVSSNDTLRLGAAVYGSDVLGYHAYGASATWALTPPEAAGYTPEVPDWNAWYVYRRWRPQVLAAASRSTSFFEGEPTADGLSTSSISVEETAEIGVQLPVRRVRYSHALQLSAVYVTDTRTRDIDERSRNRSGPRLSWRYSSVQRPGFSISPERGVNFGIATELIREAFGASADAKAVTVDARAYLPGFGRNHVLAIRTAGGYTQGSTTVSRVFLLGGGSANPVPGVLDSDGISLLRGFAANTFAGRQLALINLDYRFPLARPQRGVGAWPFMLHTIHAALTLDAGHTWIRRFDANDIKTSIGAELSANVVLGYVLPLTLTMGTAYGHDGGGTVESGPSAYVRIGHAF